MTRLVENCQELRPSERQGTCGREFTISDIRDQKALWSFHQVSVAVQKEKKRQAHMEIAGRQTASGEFAIYTCLAHAVWQAVYMSFLKSLKNTLR